MSRIKNLWNSKNSRDWEKGVENYWHYVKSHLRTIEEEMQHLNRESVRAMDAKQWYTFLHEKYFRWKYTEDHRYKTTTNSLKMYEHEPFLSILHGLRARFFHLIKRISRGVSQLLTNKRTWSSGSFWIISGTVSDYFGTVDQFVVKALRQIPDLPEREDVAAIKKPDALKLTEGVL